MVFLSFFSLLGILPLYIVRVHGSPVTVGLMMALFTVTAVLTRPYVGRLADRRDRRWVLGAGLAVITISFGLYGLVRSIPWLGVLRVLHGVGWALASTSASALVADVVPPARRGEAMGYYANFSDIAMAAGPWTAVFFLDRIGFIGAFLIGAGLAALAILPLFLMRLSSRPSPAAEQPLLVPTAFLPAAVMLTVSFAFGAVITYLPVYAPTRGLSGRFLGVDRFAWFFVFYAVSLLLVRGPVGRISDRHSRAHAILPGMLLLILATAYLAYLYGLPGLVVFALIFGAGFGAAQPGLMAWTVDRTPRSAWGGALATFFAAYDLGIGISALLLGWVAEVTSYRLVYLLAAGVLTAGLILFRIRGGSTGSRAQTI